MKVGSSGEPFYSTQPKDCHCSLLQITLLVLGIIGMGLGACGFSQVSIFCHLNSLSSAVILGTGLILSMLSLAISLCPVVKPNSISSKKTASQEVEFSPDSSLHKMANISFEYKQAELASLIKKQVVGVKRNADKLNEINALGQTPLHLAVANMNWHMLHEMLKFKPDLSIQDFAGNTPLHIACRKFGGEEIGEYLVGEEDSRLCIVRSLIQAGAPLDTLNKFGETPLDMLKAAITQPRILKNGQPLPLSAKALRLNAKINMAFSFFPSINAHHTS